MRLAVLASGAGSLFSAVLDAARSRRLAVEVVGLITDRHDAAAVDVARAAAVPCAVVDPHEHAERDGWDRSLEDTLRALGPDWVASLGFMRILGPRVLGRYPERILNTHPALLPAFPGRHAVRDALAHGVHVTGCTVHLVDAGIDSGPILAQEAVPVLVGDDEITLHDRIRIAERRLVVDVLAAVAADPLSSHADHPGRRVIQTSTADRVTPRDQP